MTISTWRRSVYLEHAGVRAFSGCAAANDRKLGGVTRLEAGNAGSPPERPHARTPALPNPLRPLVVVTFLIYLGFGVTAPVLPLFGRALGAGTASVGALVAAFSVTSFSLDLIGGRIGDRVGARRVAVGGAVLVGLGGVLSALAPSFGVLLLARLLTGAGSAFYVTTAMTILARTTPPERMGRAMGTYQGAILAGVSVGPAVGGLLTEVAGLRLPFLLYGLAAAACAGIAWRTLPAHLPRPPAAAATGSFFRLLRGPVFLTALAIAFVVFVIRAGVTSTTVPLYAAEELGLSRAFVGLALTVAAVANLLLLPHAGRLADRRPRRVATTLGLVAGLAGLALLGAESGVPGLYLAMAITGVATAYAGVTPAAIIADVTPPAQSGTALGAYRMAVDGASIAAPLAAGIIAGGAGYRGVFLAFLLPLALVLLATLRLPDTRRPLGEPAEAG